MDRERLADTVESFAVVLPARLLVGFTLAGVLAAVVDAVASAPVGMMVAAVLFSPFALDAAGFRPTLPAALAHFLLSQGVLLFGTVGVALALTGGRLPDAAVSGAYIAAVALSFALVFTDWGRRLRSRVSRRAKRFLGALRGE